VLKGNGCVEFETVVLNFLKKSGLQARTRAEENALDSLGFKWPSKSGGLRFGALRGLARCDNFQHQVQAFLSLLGGPRHPLQYFLEH
jgi:hypothetical protein